MSDLKQRMAALSGGAAVDVTKLLARSPDTGGSGGSPNRSGEIARPRIERKVGLG